MNHDLSGRDLIEADQSGRPPWPKSKVPKASAVLADKLRDEIVLTKMPVGRDLPHEGELIERTGYSRGTVREALRLLESEGLISTRRGPYGGVRVSRPDVSQATRSIAVLLALSDATLGDLFHFRLGVESAAASLAATHATQEQIEAMFRATDDEGQQTVEGVVSFHHLIADSCGNEFYRVTLGYVLDIAAWHAPQAGLSYDDVCVARGAHRDVVEAIAAREPDRASEAMERHLKSFLAVVKKSGHLDSPVLRPERWASNASRR
jgi:DNA-binding FadR family transcriptional regulator